MTKFVVFTPDLNDYLAQFSESGTTWSNDLQAAYLFDTTDDAGEACAKVVSQTPDGEQPYSLFLFEVTYRHGQWQLTEEDAGSPGQLSDTPPTKPDICPVKFVVYQPGEDSYIAAIEKDASAALGSGQFARTAWTTYPHQAIGYPTFEDAERDAAALIGSQGGRLTICELHETEDQYWTKPIKGLFAIDPSLN